jgi:uracil-DNA glycosylase family 4
VVLRASRASRSPLTIVRDAIVSCERCPRLRTYCTEIARTKRRAYRHEVYWGKPFPVSATRARGDRRPRAGGTARIAPAASSPATPTAPAFRWPLPRRFLEHRDVAASDDGLKLRDAFIAAAVRCAPPDNKPTPEEIVRCLPHLDAEIAALPRIRVVVALGKIGFDAYLRLLRHRGAEVRPRPEFGHALAHDLPSGQVLIGCYHPSRQNTNTGKLTAAMMDAVFRLARQALG